MDQYYNLAVYCHCMTRKRQNFDTPYPDEYLEHMRDQHGWKYSVNFNQIRQAWLAFLRTMFSKTFPFSNGKDIIPLESAKKENGDNFIPVAFEAAGNLFGNLIFEHVFCCRGIVMNPLQSDRELPMPKGCHESFFQDNYIKFPCTSGTKIIIFHLPY